MLVNPVAGYPLVPLQSATPLAVPTPATLQTAQKPAANGKSKAKNPDDLIRAVLQQPNFKVETSRKSYQRAKEFFVYSAALAIASPWIGALLLHKTTGGNPLLLFAKELGSMLSWIPFSYGVQRYQNGLNTDKIDRKKLKNRFLKNLITGSAIVATPLLALAIPGTREKFKTLKSGGEFLLRSIYNIGWAYMGIAAAHGQQVNFLDMKKRLSAL